VSETVLERIPLDQDVAARATAARRASWARRAGQAAWVSVEFWHTAGGRQGRALGGGLFPLRPAVDALPGETWSLGIDFGTSNTVVAVKRKDGTLQCVSPERGATARPPR
jgi:hypothetical protein